MVRYSRCVIFTRNSRADTTKRRASSRTRRVVDYSGADVTDEDRSDISDNDADEGSRAVKRVRRAVSVARDVKRAQIEANIVRCLTCITNLLNLNAGGSTRSGSVRRSEERRSADAHQ